MNRFQRLITIMLAALFVLGALTPALATEEQGGSGDGGETTETTVAPELIFEGDGPAVVIPDVPEEVADQPWTARFLYPLIAIGTVLLIVGLVIGYNRSIRGKYKVVR